MKLKVKEFFKAGVIEGTVVNEPNGVDIDVCCASFAEGLLHSGLLRRITSNVPEPIGIDSPGGSSQPKLEPGLGIVIVESFDRVSNLARPKKILGNDDVLRLSATKAYGILPPAAVLSLLITCQ